jgi:hypothetical protein
VGTVGNSAQFCPVFQARWERGKNMPVTLVGVTLTSVIGHNLKESKAESGDRTVHQSSEGSDRLSGTAYGKSIVESTFDSPHAIHIRTASDQSKSSGSIMTISLPSQLRSLPSPFSIARCCAEFPSAGSKRERERERESGAALALQASAFPVVANRVPVPSWVPALALLAKFAYRVGPVEQILEASISAYLQSANLPSTSTHSKIKTHWSCFGS